MKQFSHPSQNVTLIQTKDGSTIRKNWVYFRTYLRLESESRVWRAICEKQTNSNFISRLSPAPTSGVSK